VPVCLVSGTGSAVRVGQGVFSVFFLMYLCHDVSRYIDTTACVAGAAWSTLQSSPGVQDPYVGVHYSTRYGGGGGGGTLPAGFY
jgi:hypothetical protein